MSTSAQLWQPTAERIAAANVTAFANRIGADPGRTFPEYADLWRWSNDDPEAFWRAVWDYAGIIGTRGERTLVHAERMPGAQWFPDAKLNFAENLLARRGADAAADALVFRGEEKSSRRLSHAELEERVSQCAQALAAMGVGVGDRVGALRREHARGRHRDARRDVARRDLVVVLARFRRAGRARPFQPDRAARARDRRRLLVQRQAATRARPRRADRDAPAERRARGDRAVSRRFRWRDSRGAGHRGRRGVGCVPRAVPAASDRVRAPAVRSSGVHPLLVGHDGRAEVHRARRGRDAPAARQGAVAAR